MNDPEFMKLINKNELKMQKRRKAEEEKREKDEKRAREKAKSIHRHHQAISAKTKKLIEEGYKGINWD